MWVTGVAHGVINGTLVPLHPSTLLAYAVALGGAVLLTAPQDAPLEPARAVGVAACALTVSSIVLVSAAAAEEIWLFDFAGYLLALLVARGNIAVGLVGGAAQVTAAVWWGLVDGQPMVGVLDLLAVPVMSFGLGLSWQFALTRIVRSERAHRSVAAEAQRAADAAREARRAFERELVVIREEVTPLLSRLADGADIDDELRRELVVVEGATRDRIRSPHLQDTRLNDAIADRRRAGVVVTVLGEPSPGRPRIQRQLADRLAELIGSSTARTITVRTPPGESGDVSVTFDGPAGAENLVLGGDGTLRSRR